MLRRSVHVSRRIVPAARYAVRANIHENLPATITKHIPKPPPLRKKLRGEERRRLYKESILIEGRSVDVNEEVKEHHQEHSRKKWEQQQEDQYEQSQKHQEGRKEESKGKEQTNDYEKIFSYARLGEEWLSNQETTLKEAIEKQQTRHPIIIGLLLTAFVAVIVEKTMEKTVFADNRLKELEKNNKDLHNKNDDLIQLVHSYKQDLKDLKDKSETAMNSAEQKLHEQAKQIKELELDVKLKSDKIIKLQSRFGEKQASFGKYSVYYKDKPKEPEVDKKDEHTTSKKP